LATLHVEKDKSNIIASQLPIEAPLYVDMGEVRFLGSISPPRKVQRGEMFHLGLYWRARAKPRGDYVVAVQLRDGNGSVAWEQVSRPAANAYPTLLWDEGEVLLDWHDVHVPKGLPVGDYQLFVVLQNVDGKHVLGQVALSALSIVDRAQ
jgi:hypothetical protein